MKDDKDKIDPIDYYFADLNKHGSMSQVRLNEKLGLVKDNTVAYISLLTAQSEAQDLYVAEWQRVVHTGKKVHKMSVLTGRTQHENITIGTGINKNMRELEKDQASLLPTHDFVARARFLVDCNFNMAVHSEILKQYAALPTAQYQPYVIKLCDQFKSRIIRYNNEIAQANLKLVIKFAKEYRHVGVPLSDLIQEGNIGLMRAIEKFDPSKGLKFTTYAVWWIKQGFLKVIKQNNRLIRIPTHIQETLSRISKFRETTMEETGIELTMTNLAQSEGLTEEELETIYNVCMEPISIETVVTGEQNKQLKDFIPDTTVDLEADIDAFSLSGDIKEALDKHLTSVEKKVIIMRYGLFKETVHTLEEIANTMNKSRERIRQLESSAKAKLLKLATNLRDYTDESS